MPRNFLIELRRDTAANWTSVNPLLASGELGFETDTGKIKCGDGTTTWTTLPYLTATTLTGDVTGSGTGSFATAIGANKVTLAQMAQIATASFLGRNTAAVGNVEVLSTATVKTLLGLTGNNSGDQNTFTTIAVAGQSDVVADAAGDTVTLVAGTNITLTTNPATDTITIAASGSVAFTAEDAQDAVGAMVDTSLVYVDATPLLTRAALTGDITASQGSNVTTLASVGTPGTYQSVTTDAKGRVTAGTNPNTLAGYGITDAQPLDTDLTAIAALTTTAFGRSLLALADAAALRTAAVLGTLATQNGTFSGTSSGTNTGDQTTFDGGSA